MSDPQPPEGVLHEYRPSCSRSDCDAWPVPGGVFCARHIAEIEAGVKPGLSEAQWVGGVPPEVARAKADRLEAQYAAQEEEAKVAELVKAGWPEETARIEAGRKPSRVVGPDPDTTYPAETLRIDVPTWNQRVGIDPRPQPDYVPADPESPTADLLRYLRGEHGEIKRACAVAMVKGILEGLRAL